jgi:oxygen-independent coproporphyrinogen-3 oxidase
VEPAIAEFILQLKLGTVLLEPLRMRYGVDPLECFSAPLRRFAAAGWLNCRKHAVELTRSGLLRVDRLLPYFYDPTFHSVRYS